MSILEFFFKHTSVKLLTTQPINLLHARHTENSEFFDSLFMFHTILTRTKNYLPVHQQIYLCHENPISSNPIAGDVTPFL